MKWFLSIIGLCAVTMVSLAQPDTSVSRFSAFGRLPVKTPDSLLGKWREADDMTSQIRAGLALMHFHERAGTHDSVIFYAQDLQRRMAESRLDDREKLRYSATVGEMLAEAYREKGLYEESLRHYLSGIGAGEELADRAIIDQHRFGQATVYFLRKEYEKAIPIYHEIREQSDNDELVQLVNKQLGRTYLALNDPTKAKPYLEMALHYFEQEGQLKLQLETQLHLALVAEMESQVDSAFTIYDTVKDRALEAQYFDVYIRAGQRMGDMLMAQKDYDGAQMLLSMVYINAIQWGNLEAQRDVLNSLQQLHAAIGDYQNAYALMSQYQGVSNEILEQQNKQEVNELEVKYQTAQREKEILRQENELRYQKTMKYALLIGFLVVLIPIIALLYLYYQKLQTQSKLNASREEANQQQIRAMLKEKELELLAASVEGQEQERKRIAKELHDRIGGNLAAIKLQLSLPDGGVETVIEQVDETYHQIRDLSHNLVPKQFNNTGFTTLIETYLKGFSLHPEVDISFRVYPEEEANRLPTPLKVEVYAMIQELMTNTHKHANASRIAIQLTLVDDALTLIFEDNGKGFDQHRTSAGIGLHNIGERLKSLGGTMAIDSLPGRGTVVDIEIPLTPETYEI